jgi:hypothetical protein
MKRWSLREAFTGYGENIRESMAVTQEDRDVAEFEVVGGRLMVVLPQEVPDEDALDPKWLQGTALWELELENGEKVVLVSTEGCECVSLTFR